MRERYSADQLRRQGLYAGSPLKAEASMKAGRRLARRARRAHARFLTYKTALYSAIVFTLVTFFALRQMINAGLIAITR